MKGGLKGDMDAQVSAPMSLRDFPKTANFFSEEGPEEASSNNTSETREKSIHLQAFS